LAQEHGVDDQAHDLRADREHDDDGELVVGRHPELRPEVHDRHGGPPGRFMTPRTCASVSGTGVTGV
jgi:hypothetical protein